MLDSDDFPLPLENLFFERLNVHRVRPLHQEASPWQLEAPPSLTHIPATQEIQAEAESLSNLYSSTQITETFWASFKQPACRKALPSKAISPYNLTQNKKEGDETGGGSSSSTSRCYGLWGGEGFRDYSQGGCHRVGGVDESLQDSGHAAISRCVSLDCNKSPTLQKSLLKIHGLTGGGDSSNMDDLSGGGGGSSSQTTSTPQTFLSQVTMTTAPPPPPPQPPPPPATVGRAAPPFPDVAPLSPPPSGSSAASGRPPQQAPHAEMQDKGTKRAFVPPMTPRPLHIQGFSGVLRPVCEIPIKFRPVFSEFPFFNYVQSKALDDVFYTNKNFVACAPTGSGKTVLFELAIIRLLMETQEPWSDVKAVYMAPIKALCSQSFESWRKKFGPLGLICKELTGDTEIDDFFEIQESNIILTTPEKWDSMTRKWRDNCLLQMVRLFLIDEVHVVKDATRGATLEVVVSRMKAVHAYRTAQNPDAGLSMRFVAVSATIPNITDIAEWLSDECGPAAYLDMDESHRPVQLRKVVLGFPCSAKQSEFMFDLSLNYKMANIIQTYSDQKPALVFCSTRKGAQQSAAVLAKDARFIISIEHKQRLMKYASSILDSKLRDLVMLGVGYHHAGVDLSDRKMIEEAFTLGDLPVLFTTRTLAMGVNLPAHLVVIKSTMQYVAGSCEEYSEADLLQMIGRAGRPQFDTSATAVIMTKIQTRDKYSQLMSGMEIIESSLHGHLVEHLNAEVVLQTISDVNMALDWIRSSFLYIRALKNPTYYGFSADLDRCGIEAKLQELCLKNLNSLSSIGLIDMDEDINIKPSEAGRLMARYCVAYDTMKQFISVVGTENLPDLIELVSKSREFSHIPLRVNEKRPLNTLNRDKNRITIRFPLEGKIKTSEMKVNCLIQAQLGNISIQEFGLTQDTAKIFRNGMRLSRCLSEFLSQRSRTGFSAVINSLILAKCFRAKLWENSPFVSKQLEKIGQSLSNAMVSAGLTTFNKIEQTNPRDLELILKRHPPFGDQIRESVIHLPKYEVALEQLPRYSSATAEIVVKVSLKNQAQLLSRRTARGDHYVSLIIGDSDNAVVFLQKLTCPLFVSDLVFLKGGSWSKKIDISKASKGEEITVNLISSEYVGLDIQQNFTLYYSAARRPETENPYKATPDPSRHRPQQSADQPATQRENATADKDPGNTQELSSCSRRQCNHFCKNKNLCGHDCCKVGVTVARKRSLKPESSFCSFLKDLRSRCDTLVETPVKRLKMKMNEGPLSVKMQEFAYKPKMMLPPVSWSEGSHYGGSAGLHTDIGWTGGDGALLPDVVCLSDLDRNYEDYMEDTHVSMEEPFQAAAASQIHDQSSSMWMTPEINTRNQTVKQQPYQVNASSSAYSTAVSRQGARCKNPPFSQIPTVSFELGNESDDWGDFDDQELVHASETPSFSRPADARPQIQHRAENNKLAYVAASSPAFISRQQDESWVTASTTAPRSILSTLSPEMRKMGISSIAQPFTSQKRITLDWKKKSSIVFSQEIAAKTPEIQPKQLTGAPVTRRLDFFSAVSVPQGVGSPFHRSSSNKEEGAFISIFDGIF